MTIDRTKLATERVIGVAALVVAVLAPTLFSGFWLNSILTQALILGIGAASLIFLSAYGGMISLAQTGLMGIAGYALAVSLPLLAARLRGRQAARFAGLRTLAK